MHVLAPDLPGHGARHAERFSLDGAVQTIVDAVRTAPPGPLYLAGDSLGGYTAQAAAAHLPADRLKGLVLGGSSHAFIGAPTIPYRARAWLFRVMFALGDERKMVARKIPAVLKEFGMNETDAAATLAAGVHMSAFPQAVNALCGVDFRTKLAAIAQPVLFINGDLDTNHIRGESAYTAAARDARIERFAGCEHGVSMRRSGDYARLVAQFVQQTGGGSSPAAH